MTNDRESARRLLRFFVTLVLIAGRTLTERPALAQSPEQLKSARELFQDAYRDEQEQRYEMALEKFQRVARVKESASVRYRIASVLEALGRLRESRDEFRALAARRSQGTTSEEEIAESAAEHAARLDKRIPRIVVSLERAPRPDTRVVLDGAPLPATVTPRTIEVDPGEHVIAASDPTSAPFERKVHVQAGDAPTVKIAFADPLPPPTSSAKAWGIVSLAGGGVLLATTAVLLVVRQSDIDELRETCPEGDCPSSRRDDVLTTRDRAELLGPLGLGIGALGIVAAGIGTYVLLKPNPRPGDRAASPALRFAGAASSSGGTLGIGGSF